MTTNNDGSDAARRRACPGGTAPTAGTSPAARPETQHTRRRLGGVLNRLGRLALVGGIVAAGWYPWTIYSDLLPGPRPAPPPDTASSAPATLPRFELMGS